MKNSPHKLGANRHDRARKAHKHDPNFSQSRDIREDRAQRQIKTGVPKTFTPEGPL